MLGIIGAMDEEVAKLKETMQDVTVETKASMEFYKGTMNGKEVGQSCVSTIDKGG